MWKSLSAMSGLYAYIKATINNQKFSARWVSKQLTEDHKRQHVRCAEEVMRRFEEEADDLLDSIITENETWSHHYTSDMKQQSKQWCHPTYPKPKKFKQTLLAGKIIATVFWDRKIVLLVYFMPQETTINAERYCQIFQKLCHVIKSECSGMLTEEVSFHHDNAHQHTVNRTQNLITKFG